MKEILEALPDLDPSMIAIVIAGAILVVLVVLVKARSAPRGNFPAPLVKTLDEALLNRKPKYKLPKVVLVTGGNGFVGRRIVDMCLDQGCEVTVFDLVKGFNDNRVSFVVGNLLNKAEVESAVRGKELVIHVAAPHANHPKKVQYDVNVVGTTNLLEASAAAGVKKFVFTSSASVVYQGVDQQAADETTPIPTQALDSYTETKAMAEKLVLEANGKNGMLTAAIRPHGIFGPGDRQFFPVLIENAKKGKTKYAIGDGKNVADFTFVGNVAHGHLLAAEKLGQVDGVAGQAFFVTNDSPMPFWDFLNQVLTGFGFHAASIQMPAGLMYVIGGIMEMIASVLALVGVNFQPTFTRSRVQYLTTHHYYSIEKAKKLLGYKPAWTQEESMDLCFYHMKELRNPLAPRPKRQPLDPNKPAPTFSKAEVARHNTRDDAWLIIDDKVYDVTDYVGIHPGDDAILNNVGGDSSEGFKGPQHPPTVWDVIRQYHIGDLKKE